MKYFITGTPGSGKTAIGKLLQNKGFKFVDVDHEPGLAHWYNKKTSKVVKSNPKADAAWYDQHDWNWDRKNLKNLLNKYNEQGIFVSGITSNQANDLDLFDKIFLLKTDQKELRKRMLQRKNKDDKSDVDHVFEWHKAFEDEMIKHRALTIDANQNPDEVFSDLLRMIK